jgi:single-stranded-DNA-specific exonuclease
MRNTKNLWIESEVDKETVKNLASELNISQILSKILVARGINTFKSAQEFFRPHSNQFHDGFLMKGMEQAVSRIKKAVEKNENILVYGDYDVDGTCSVALIIRFLQKITTKIFHYQPHREKEGYGISLKSVEWCNNKNINLVIALDCGIKDVLASESMKKNSIDLIICDHHKPGEIIPEAIAILNPKQQGCQYPFKELCGCGIGLKLIQSYNHKFNLNLNFEIFFQLAAVASAADIVPLIDENRLIVFLGLKALNDQPIEPFKLLFKNLKKEGEINIGDLIFKIAPRINAVGRLATAKIAAKYLISDSENLLENLKTIESHNEERKKIDEIITKEALSQLEKQPLDRVTNLVYSKDWHKGVVGIVASRIIEKYYLPTIVLSEGENILTGSARSVKGFDIYSVLDNLKHLFVRFGGHKCCRSQLKKRKFRAISKSFRKGGETSN